MPEQAASILDIGIISAVGIGARQTAASVRAGIARISETSIYDKRFSPFTMAVLPDEVLPPLDKELEEVVGLTSRQIRMLRLASPALQEATKGADRIGEIPLYLGVPETLPDRPKAVHDSFLEHLGTQSGVRFHVAESRLFPQGRAAGLIALKEAMLRLAAGTVPFVLVGGVDTFVDLFLLGTLDMEDRILGPTVMDGFVPGEGAGFLLLGSPAMVRQKGKKPFALVQSVGIGFEKGHLYSDEIYKGDGLAESFHSAFSSISKSVGKIRTVYAGLNGENFGAKEWGVAYMRNNDRFEEDFRLEHPVDCFGDPGAALGPMMAGIAAIGMNKGYFQGPCLAWCSSDRGDRAAAVIYY